ncbi:proteophosphoglycan ppg4 [Rhodotorula toruloides]|uniref:Proteophosphoglycan ppg4 n=1 Tax=Rhodotorula toruloides TaxID=5286 RepID=A0A511KB31_RHOTO|nr:proteophosphoglycan ppg4 [Rhodotorula toruloides]
MSTSAARPDGPASLSSLSRKLKEHIAQFLDDLSLYDDDEDWEDESAAAVDAKEEKEEKVDAGEDEEENGMLVTLMEEDPEDARKATLAAINLVNKEWAEIVAPLRWKEVWLYPCTTRDLLRLTRDVLPRHGSHVDRLLIRETPYDTILDGNEADDVPAAEGRALEVIEEAEKLLQLEAGTLEWELRTQRARNALLGDIIKRCPNVKYLDLEGPLRMFRRGSASPDSLVDIKEDELPNAAAKALKSLGGQIEHLGLLVPPDGFSTEKDAAEYISAFPYLKTLDLNCFVIAAPDGEDYVKVDREALYKALTSLKNLEELDLGESTFVNDATATLDFAAPLKHLALGDSSDLTVPGLRKLVERFSATLESLEMDDTVPAGDEEEKTAPTFGEPFNLPKLTNLELATTQPASFLSLFDTCPLVEVLLGECPQLTAKDFIAFLDVHKATLKVVDIEEDGIAGEEDVEDPLAPIATWCEEHNVKFALFPSTAIEDMSDDEHEDDCSCQAHE